VTGWGKGWEGEVKIGARVDEKGKKVIWKENNGFSTGKGENVKSVRTEIRKW
jgi:hypothetical protein